MLEILNEIEKKESNVNVAGGKGYGVGKVYSDKTVGVLRMLGKSMYEDDEDENKEQKESSKEPVKISKVFKKESK
jgi:hypothetical protein